MRAPLLSLALVCAPLLLASAAHAERHYDCTKPGNANKAVCKTASPAPAAPMAAAPSAPHAMTASTRHYDCSKAGNANKAACKTAPKAAAAPALVARAGAAAPIAAPRAPRATPVAASAPAPAASGTPRIVVWTEKNGKVVHYDCSKRGNLNKQACKAT